MIRHARAQWSKQEFVEVEVQKLFTLCNFSNELKNERNWLKIKHVLNTCTAFYS